MFSLVMALIHTLMSLSSSYGAETQVCLILTCAKLVQHLVDLTVTKQNMLPRKVLPRRMCY